LWFLKQSTLQSTKKLRYRYNIWLRRIRLLISDFFVDKKGMKKPVGVGNFLWHVFFDNSVCSYCWYHNILIQIWLIIYYVWTFITIGIIYDFGIAYSFNVSSFIYTSLHVIIQNTWSIAHMTVLALHFSWSDKTFNKWFFCWQERNEETCRSWEFFMTCIFWQQCIFILLIPQYIDSDMTYNILCLNIHY
jgi:hypothetical protein